MLAAIRKDLVDRIGLARTVYPAPLVVGKHRTLVCLPCSSGTAGSSVVRAVRAENLSHIASLLLPHASRSQQIGFPLHTERIRTPAAGHCPAFGHLAPKLGFEIV